MKNLNLFFFLAFCPFLYAQPIFSEGFETFLPSGQPAPFDWQEPERWTSSNLLTEFIAPGVTRTEDAYEGSSAVRLEARNLFGQPTPARLLLGAARVDFLSRSLDAKGAGFPLEGQPNRLTGYYNAGGQGLGRLVVQISRFENGERSLVYEKEQQFSATDEFTLFEVSFDSYTYEAGKDTLLLAFSSAETIGAELVIDALNMDYLTSVKEEPGQQEGHLSISPVPVRAGGELHIALSGITGKDMRTVSLLAADGGLLRHFTADAVACRLPTYGLAPGLYFVVVETAEGVKLAEKVIVAP